MNPKFSICSLRFPPPSHGFLKLQKTLSVTFRNCRFVRHSFATISQIEKIADAGADLVRVSCPDQESTKALKTIVKNSPIPIIADIHFHYKRAIEAADAGAACLRINPGNIGSLERIKEVINEFN